MDKIQKENIRSLGKEHCEKDLWGQKKIINDIWRRTTNFEIKDMCKVKCVN